MPCPTQETCANSHKTSKFTKAFSWYTVKKGIVITTDSLLFQIQMNEHNSLLCGGELHPHSQPTFLHIIIPSWQLIVSMQQIGSLICNEHDKLMVKMTILLLLWALTVNPTPLLYCENYTYTRMSILCVCSWSAGVSNVTASAGTAGPIWISKSPTYQD